jgi:multidrug efflux pump subunit AcrA (membrane-fusion protein)
LSGRDRVWVYADIYEYESGLVKKGQIMDITSAALAGRHFEGPLVAINKVINPNTRTLRVRAEIPNASGVLKPEMFVDATIHVDLGKRPARPHKDLWKWILERAK